MGKLGIYNNHVLLSEIGYSGGSVSNIDSISVNGNTITPDEGKNIELTLDKNTVGLSNVDNTSDLDKPISTLTQKALDDKAKSTDLTTHTSDTNNPHSVTASQVGAIPITEKGAVNGVAELDENGKVLSSQLPNYDSNIIEGSINVDKTEFTKTGDINPTTPESGKLYIDVNTNITYRWNGTLYISVNSDLTLGETSSTAYRGDMGKIAYEHSQLTSGNPHNITKSDVGLSNVDNTSDLDKPISSATQTALNWKVNVDGDKILTTNDFTNLYKNKLEGIEDNAKSNVQSDWNEVDISSDAYILNKPTIPTSTNELFNNSDFVSDSSYVHTDNNYSDFEKQNLQSVVSSNEKVKLLSTSTSADYLGNLVDATTIQVDVQNGKIVAKSLDGLNVTVATLNYLQGVDYNIAEKINSFGNSMQFKGVVNTDDDLDLIAVKENGDTYIVKLSASNGDKTMTFIYDGISFTPIAETTIEVRDFSINPIILTQEVTGKLPIENINTSGFVLPSDLAKYMEKDTYLSINTVGYVKGADVANGLVGLNSTVSQIDNSVTDSHKHENQTNILDKLSADASGKLQFEGNKVSDYVHPSTHPYSMITDTPTSLPADGGNSTTVNHHTVFSDVPTNAVFTDTITEVVNVSTAIESEGKALNAVQLNPNVDGTLQKQINNCLNYKGFVTSDFNNYKTVGTYTINSDNKPHAPFNGYGILEVTKATDGYYTKQVATNILTCEMYVRVITDYVGIWTNWQQIATTEKIEFLCTENNGYTITSQKCYKLNGEYRVTLYVTKTDGSAFSVANNTIGSLPFVPYETVNIATASGKIGTGTLSNYVNAFIQTDKTISVAPSIARITGVWISARGGIA